MENSYLSLKLNTIKKIQPSFPFKVLLHFIHTVSLRIQVKCKKRSLDYVNLKFLAVSIAFAALCESLWLGSIFLGIKYVQIALICMQMQLRNAAVDGGGRQGDG